ncbi:uncharacterized protein LOC122065765 [Macadamia integrifolia]|uniref:uncharacterized protein LOC122065765 n=1 Tax=Macadamia integrifolia TaxID=60698 RepID=UPI001C4E8608|nr:uncharacterized protein LOC122065765 [Macadamia integrifolia]
MDRESKELQSLGSIGIYKESFKIIFSWRKIFTKITFALILPYTFIFLAYTLVSDILFSNIINNSRLLQDGISSEERVTIWLVKVAYLVFSVIFSLLYTSAVVYTTASFNTTKEPTFKKVMTIIPKVWKRYIVTYLWTFIILFLYTVIAMVFISLSLIFFVLGPLQTSKSSAALFNPGIVAGTVLLIVLVVLYFSGVVYMSTVWQFSWAISVLEDCKGTKAMMKSKALLKGKMRVALAILFEFSIVLMMIQFGFKKMVVEGEKLGMGMWIRVLSGIVCFLLLMQFFLFWMVVQTVFYIVCKSYHHECIDKSLLEDHLEVYGYVGEYAPLKIKDDVQLEQCDV